MEKDSLTLIEEKLDQQEKLLKEMYREQQAHRDYFLDIWIEQNRILEKMDSKGDVIIMLSKEIALLKLTAKDHFKIIEEKIKEIQK